MRLYGFFYATIAWFFRLFYRIRVTGAENEPQDGAFFVCANHISNADTIVLAVSLKHKLHFMAKAELFRIPVLKHFFRAMGAFPINRGTADVASLKTAITLIEQGEVVAVYPQGKRYMRVDPRTTSPKSGIGMMEYRTGAPVLPVYIDTPKYRLVPFRRTRVFIGEPIRPEEFSIEGPQKSEYDRAAGLVFDRILALMPEEPNDN